MNINIGNAQDIYISTREDIIWNGEVLSDSLGRYLKCKCKNKILLPNPISSPGICQKCNNPWFRNVNLVVISYEI